MQFRDLGLSRFWISPSVRSEFLELSEEALKVVMQFSTTYLCEKGFSPLLQLKQNTEIDLAHVLIFD
jgi:hypothetical protein